ncbi:MAG: cytidylate kinase-like family protein [Lachnospiraceae bacterium]|nr:cytidylate kinase-like family protein [Lachnospiraceae bacterium]
MKWNPVIAIARQFGSGGHEIGERVAEKLGLPCYDRALIDLASQKLGVDQYDLEQVDEAALNRFLAVYQVPEKANPITGSGMTLNDSLYMAQCEIIEALALKGPCVIVGRTAGEVLEKNPRCINIFIGASKEDRAKRIAERYELTEREAAEAIRRVDRKRKFYYETYTDKVWGSLESYDIMLNVSDLGIEGTVEWIAKLYETV